MFEAHDIALSFDGKRLFRNVNIDIKKGERVFLIGANGCGKTSLFKIFTGQYTPDFGSFKYGSRVQYGYFDQAQAGPRPRYVPRWVPSCSAATTCSSMCRNFPAASVRESRYLN